MIGRILHLSGFINPLIFSNIRMIDRMTYLVPLFKVKCVFEKYLNKRDTEELKLAFVTSRIFVRKCPIFHPPNLQKKSSLELKFSYLILEFLVVD